MSYAEELEVERLVLQRIAELNSAGLWKRLKQLPAPPKEPPCHWDYLLEEMEWMAKIFAEERIMKEKRAKKCSKMIQIHFRSEETKLNKKTKEEEIQRRRTANQISKMIKQFWSNVGKLVNHKFLSISDIARRKKLDEKLNKVLNTSEKFVEEISLNLENQENTLRSTEDDDESFASPIESESDVEDTIEQEEKLSKLKAKDYERELNDLEDENNLSYEQLIAKYSSYLESSASDIPEVNGSYDNSDSDKNGKKVSKYRLRGRPGRKTDNKNKKKAEEADFVNSNDLNLSAECNDSSLLDLVNLEDSDNFQPSGHTFASTKVTIQAPRLLRFKLREYQHIGLEWLVTLYDRKLNGILADEMGLGKTIQTIALLAYLALERGNWGPHLIIVPTSLVMNWELELLRWCPSFKITTYVGSPKERKRLRKGWSDPRFCQICITSYTLAVQDQICFRRRPWEYMILDEAHNIKNFKSQRWQVLLNFNTRSRLLLTGTPLQNNLMELWSLLHFLMPHVFESHSEFREWFSKPISEITSGSREYNENIVKQFHKTLRPFMLRRLKSEVEKQMPKKVEHIIKCDLSKRQRRLYDEFMARSDIKNSINYGSFLSVLSVLMQLRKVCNHPDLFETRPIVSPFRMEGISPAFPKCMWDIIAPESHNRDLINTMLCGVSPFNDDLTRIPQLVYAPDFPVRHFTDGVSETAKINVYLDEEETPVPRVDMELNRMTIQNGVVWQWKFMEFPQDTSCFENGYNRKITLDSVGEEEMSQSSFSQSSYSHFNTTGSGTVETETEIEETEVSETDSDGIGIEDLYDCRKGSRVDHIMAFPMQMQLSEIQDKVLHDRKVAVANLDRINRRRYQTHFLIDENLINCCIIIGKLPSLTFTLRRKNKNANHFPSRMGFGTGAGHAEIMILNSIRRKNPNLIHHPFFMWKITNALNSLVKTVDELLFSVCLELVIYIPAVCIERFLEETIYRPATAAVQYRSMKSRDEFRRLFSKPLSILYPIASRQATSFPDSRLVEHDCGKLQVLSRLLRELKAGDHKVLLFTQMTKMLNILEAFLNYQGHLYLRMDGSTKPEQRQMLVDRFNKDSKIFCFLLSTRAGGLGINLTGADTVIFYDSDWNPTIDAQAQDRCHRIGQTRDVHIYRLICTNTVEENILKTSDQKRRLGEHAIEEGKFNLEYFKKDSFRQLFDLPPSGNQGENMPCSEKSDILSKEALENVLAAVEDDVEDRKAAVAVMKEAEIEKKEFSEDVSYDNDSVSSDLQQLKNDFLTIFSLASGVERYAMLSYDASFDNWSDEFVEELMQTVEFDENEAVKNCENGLADSDGESSLTELEFQTASSSAGESD